MRRRRDTSSSSFDLFLDTVCNTFGGILFIAILVAVQIRQTESDANESQSACSPEQIAQFREELDSLIAEIESASILLQTLQQTIPESATAEERNMIEQYGKLTEKIKLASDAKNELLSKYLAQIHQNASIEEKLKNLEYQLEKLSIDERELEETIRKLKANQILLEQEISTTQKNCDDLKEMIEKKKVVAEKKKDPSQNGRQEVLHLPKLVDSDRNKRMTYFVLRFNRLYVAKNNSEFDCSRCFLPNQLGIPKRNMGIAVTDTEESKKQIARLFDMYTAHTTDFSFITYSDTFERFYIVRDIVIEKGFKYEIKPSADYEVWTFGSGGKRGQVQ